MSLGDYLKGIERENSTFLKTQIPVYARLDGKGFSKFTKGMKRPYDEDFRKVMVSVATELLETTRAQLAYVQSDEISLYWEAMDVMDFNGRKEKWVGELSGLATAKMMQEVMNMFPERTGNLPRFDCRVFNVSKEDAEKFFCWRSLDCVKNSVSMVSQIHFSHKRLKNIKTEERIQMLRDCGDPWDNYPEEFRYGTIIYREPKSVEIDKSTIPEHVRHTVPDVVERNVTKYNSISPMEMRDVFKLLEESHEVSCL